MNDGGAVHFNSTERELLKGVAILRNSKELERLQRVIREHSWQRLTRRYLNSSTTVGAKQSTDHLFTVETKIDIHFRELFYHGLA